MAVPDFAHGIKVSFLDTATHDRLKAAAAKNAAPAGAAQTATASGDSDNNFFDDILDVVNPLQHLPVVSTVYRAITGDKIGPLERVAGDTLYGGLLGFASSVANIAFEKITGKDFGDTVMSWLDIGGGSDTAVAAKDAEPAADAKIAETPMPAVTASAAAPTAIVTSPALAAPAPVPVLPAAATTGPKPLTSSLQSSAPVATASVTPAQIVTLDQASLDALMRSVNASSIDADLGARAVNAYRKMQSTQTVQ